jgi:Cytochrome c
MKRPAAAFLQLAVALTLLTECGVTRLQTPTWADGAPLVAVEDSAVIARGRYLVNGPAHCVACHTVKGPLTPVDLDHPPALVGGHTFLVSGGKVRAPNLTSDPETGIGGRTDEELVEALRYGRRHDGKALLPFMELQGTSDADIVAVLSYLRSLAPVRSEVKVREINWFGRRLVGLFVHARGPSSEPPRRDPTGPSVELGQYLAKLAMCAGCHTRRSKTGGYKNERFSGGYRMADELDPSRELVTPNLTPDPETGRIVHWTEDRFVARFREGRTVPGSPMPWNSFTLMEEGDVRSIYRYLMSLAPVRNDVGPISRAKH